MKTLKLNDKKLQFILGAVEGKPAGDTTNAILKGELLIELAQLLESKDKPDLKGVKP